MSLNNPVQEPPHENGLGKPTPTIKPVGTSPRGGVQPDYAALVNFLVQPFLESPKSLSVDCEMSQGNTRAWLRVAFEGEDKGRVFGRGGRNIQAIRTVIEAAALAAGQSVHLDIYGSPARSLETPPENREGPKKDPPRRPSAPIPSSKSRTN
ncbi:MULTISPECIES: KH domain-containing protein [Cyanophyceae]|jgi:hypothetical protein|uniref:KH domain-containing protein n=1 Tax=Cyanophyceae TaxID=3028117 RepID=UPI00168975D1|nr:MULTISPECIES: KH domain-containing protein [unclassified Trichocoleus]MBD1931010.1 KH domain-containing protein [Trichocoleus sp. FACHB-69]MBD2002710.1 KH domain-containing protein [Trichocoleus sp. FACHB-40]